jgi:class 3 adenylate cyclase
MTKEYHYCWTYELKAPPEALWPLVSDTNRFNRDSGLPPMQLLGIENRIRRVKFKIPFVRVEWDEEPFEWTYPYRFGILRRYVAGPILEMRGDVRLTRLESGGTKLEYETWSTPRNFIGDIAIQLGIGIVAKNKTKDIFNKYDQIASRGDPVVYSLETRRRLPSSGHARFKSLNQLLKKDGTNERVLDNLYDYLHRADDLSIQRMRPFALADAWGLPRRTVLEAFLKSTRAGMLDMYWDLLCPECRGVAEDFGKLGDLTGSAHCNTCQIEFDVNFDQNVEVIFRPNPSIRPVDNTIEFCVGSPQRQPHIVFSMIVPPHEQIPFGTILNEGRYRLKSSGLPSFQLVSASEDGTEKRDFRADVLGWQSTVLDINLAPYIRLINDTDQNQTFQLERLVWSDQAATAADVTTLQVFRDLFSTEVLRPGEQISVGSTTLMFTDLRNSTKLYREIGDAPAFGRVREHFEILETVVASEGGAIIKTMGDAVMAAFRKPVSAIRTYWAVQKEIMRRGDPPLSIKVGIHYGPCIVVNLNDRLDYFGSTVNIAARLPSFSNGGEAIFSEAIRNDPEALEYLEKNAPPNSLTRFQSELRGFDKPMDLWRLKI